ncbi:MAG: nickel pincer cofactor biosynthesis protein LarC [Ignavibacteriales bacterium]|nr:nickel pincer cofactor biosynthesis protein LarC [Ignavibacteriales bacterium]
MMAYFDIVGGISGDMTLGACIHAGVPFEYLRDELSKIHLHGYRLECRKEMRNAMSGMKVDVVLDEHKHEPGHHHHDHRGLRDILDLIGTSTLAARVKERAGTIFTTIGEAEAKVHDTTLEQIHFHEVGAVDSIVDIVGACICFEYLGIDSFYSSPVKLGSGGTIKTQHGMMPIPTPATIEILRGYPTALTTIPFELTTPTGAGIIKSLSSGPLDMERLVVKSIGYGYGAREIPEIPNLLRIFVGQLQPFHHHDELVTVECNLDNMNPEILPFVIERLLAAAAHDAYLVPVVMKKGRPGHLLSVLVNRGGLEPVLQVIFSETTTLGVRIQPVERKKLDRSSKTIMSKFGAMKVKVIIADGKERMAPEFEECKRVALENKLPLIEVYRIVEAELHSA